VHDEGELMLVDAPDQCIEPARLGVRVRRVAEHAEGEITLR
jgi:hypothetical protein